jgi:hypothetical protein
MASKIYINERLFCMQLALMKNSNANYKAGSAIRTRTRNAQKATRKDKERTKKTQKVWKPKQIPLK